MSSGWRKFLTVLLGVIFVLSFAVFILGLAVRRDLLSPDIYMRALSDNQVYERLYTEVLADPTVQEQFKDATGIRINLISEELYAQIVGGLFLILPPAEMEANVEQFFTRLTAYLKGETDELPEDVQWGAALTPDVLAERVTRAATTVIFGAIDRTTALVVEKTVPLAEDEVVAYVDQVAEGDLLPIPRRLLQMTVGGARASADERLINLLLGPAAETASPQIRLQMQGALAADDLTGAIAIAVSQRLGLMVTARIIAAEPRLAETSALVGISGAAAALGHTRDQAVAGLNTARNYIAVLQTIMVIAAVIMLICMILIVWLNANDLSEMFKAVGFTLWAAGGLVMLGWLVVGLFLRSRVGAALSASAVGPASLDAIVDDVIASLTRSVWDSVWTTALPWLVIGLIALAFGYSDALLGFVRRLLAPVWEHKWAVLALLFGAIVVVPLLYGLLTADKRTAELPCNGHVELCDRPINEVSFASSHNAMSIADYGWVWPMHDGTITDQLQGGVRALLIDTHYIDEPAETDDGYLDTFTAVARAFARDLIANFRPPATDRIVLCHEFCALGFSYFDEMLVEVRTFLEENPREVLFLIIQDGTTPEDTTREIEEAGLLPYIYTHKDGEAWPTLREMIDSNQRLLVMAEAAGPPPAWYGNAFDVTQETPYTFIFPSQFSCVANRGAADNPFFMVNHWIQRGAPNRVDGAVVNAYDFLLGRIKQCRTERGLRPNFVAVNWWSQGNLFDVVDTLNGVNSTAATEP